MADAVDGIAVIDEAGDLVLVIEHQTVPGFKARFRVNSDSLRAVSPYFRTLLHPSKFSEGRKVAAYLDRQVSKEIPSTQLPKIYIEDVGRISSVKSLQTLLDVFLRILHGQYLPLLPPVLVNIANLIAVADRFDAITVLQKYIRSKRIDQILDSKSRRNTSLPSEEKLRQRCLIGLSLDIPAWHHAASRSLIQRSNFEQEIHPDLAIWWDLPHGIEVELYTRRCYILDTILSLQGHFLKQYTSRVRQCRFGYDSGAACDSFQLGEMVKFFAKIGTLPLTGALLGMEDGDLAAAVFKGDLVDLVDKLRGCPEYQIDANHHHCGLRTRLMPLLDALRLAVDGCGIWSDIWLVRREDYSWRDIKRPSIWHHGDHNKHVVDGDGMEARLARHAAVREMCTAKERIWEQPVLAPKEKAVKAQVERKRAKDICGSTGPVKIETREEMTRLLVWPCPE